MGRADEGWRPVPATPRHPSPLLRLLPSGPDRVHSLSSRGDRHGPPLNSGKLRGKQRIKCMTGLESGGEEGIRTLDTLLTYTHFPGVLLQPLGHLSGKARKVKPDRQAVQYEATVRSGSSGKNRWCPAGSGVDGRCTANRRRSPGSCPTPGSGSCRNNRPNPNAG